MAHGITLHLRTFKLKKLLYVPKKDNSVVTLPHGRTERTYLDSPRGMRRLS